MSNEKGPSDKDGPEPPVEPATEAKKPEDEKHETPTPVGRERDRVRNGGGRSRSVGRTIKNYLN
ncbi:MAG: hypothetical protein JWN44_5878 [Myxococcales bacterium]|nr:hypothetical protein [Myxococcales bacterium]